jgi:hypothetical protein
MPNVYPDIIKLNVDRFGMNIFTIDGMTLLGANVFGVSKSDLLHGNFSNPSVVTYTHWDPYPGFTIVPSATQVSPNLPVALLQD